MKLFEITNGWTGESYVRAYAWANNKETALQLAFPKFKEQYPKTEIDKLQVEELFDSEDAYFCTEPTDHGFWE